MKIKTKEAVHDIKTKASTVVSKTKSGVSSSSRTAKETQSSQYDSENEYAANSVQNAERKILRQITASTKKIGIWGLRTTRQNIAKWKNKTKSAVSPQKKLPPAKQAANTAKKTVKNTEKAAKASKRAAQATKKAAERTAKVVKAAVKATIQVVKAAITGIKSLVAAIAAGGSTAVVVILIICMVGLVAGSVFAIFLPSDNSSEYTIQNAMYDIEHEYDRRKSELAESIPHDVLIYEGKMSEWKDVIAVYAVKLNLSTDDPQDVATFDEKKAEKLKEIFFDMNELTTKTEIQSYTIKETKTDDDGNKIEVEEERTITYLTIISKPKIAYEVANIYGFTEKQMTALVELLQQNNEILWEGILK